MAAELGLFFTLGALFLGISLLGKFLEKIHIPWIFSSIIIGAILTNIFGFNQLANNESLRFLADLGMLFLLFIVGTDIDLRSLSRIKGSAFSLMFLSILLSFFVFTFIFHFFFGINLIIASLIALSFASVGEAVLIPILEKFDIMNRESIKILIASGSLDDIVEALALILGVNVIVGSSMEAITNMFYALSALFFISFILIIGKPIFMKIFEKIEKDMPIGIITLTCLFIFLVIGKSADIEAVAALIAGIVVRNILSEKVFNENEQQIRTLAYDFFAPLFFFYIGLLIRLEILQKFFTLIVALFLVDSLVKIVASLIIMPQRYGLKSAILTGVGLSVRFSTSIVLVTLFYYYNIISYEFFNAFLGMSMASVLIIPWVFALLAYKWAPEIR